MCEILQKKGFFSARQSIPILLFYNVSSYKLLYSSRFGVPETVCSNCSIALPYCHIKVMQKMSKRGAKGEPMHICVAPRC